MYLQKVGMLRGERKIEKDTLEKAHFEINFQSELFDRKTGLPPTKQFKLEAKTQSTKSTYLGV